MNEWARQELAAETQGRVLRQERESGEEQMGMGEVQGLYLSGSSQETSPGQEGKI